MTNGPGRPLETHHHRDVGPGHEFLPEIERFRQNFEALTHPDARDDPDAMSDDQKIAAGFASRLLPGRTE